MLLNSIICLYLLINYCFLENKGNFILANNGNNALKIGIYCKYAAGLPFLPAIFVVFFNFSVPYELKMKDSIYNCLLNRKVLLFLTLSHNFRHLFPKI